MAEDAGEEAAATESASDCGPVSTDLAAWCALAPADRPRFVDVRDEEAFAARRLEGSANLPGEELTDLLFELPEPSTPLALVAGSVGEAEAVWALLWERGWRRLPFLFVADEELWQVAEGAELLARGPVPPLARVIAYTPQPFLAQVTPLIEAGLAAAAAAAGERDGGEEEPHQRPRWTCCDVGCGSGRDAVWLAKRGCWTVRAVDRLPKCLVKVRQLSKRHGVERHVVCEEAVIKNGVVVSSAPYMDGEGGAGGADGGSSLEEHASFEQQQYDLVVVIRFLEREFYEALKAMVRPDGGFLLFVSFLDRSADGIVYESPKDPRRLLQPGELARVFGRAEDGWEAVRDEVCALPDGRFVSAFLGRRRLL